MPRSILHVGINIIHSIRFSKQQALHKAMQGLQKASPLTFSSSSITLLFLSFLSISAVIMPVLLPTPQVDCDSWSMVTAPDLRGTVVFGYYKDHYSTFRHLELYPSIESATSSISCRGLNTISGAKLFAVLIVDGQFYDHAEVALDEDAWLFKSSSEESLWKKDLMTQEWAVHKALECLRANLLREHHVQEAITKKQGWLARMKMNAMIMREMAL